MSYHDHHDILNKPNYIKTLNKLYSKLNKFMHYLARFCILYLNRSSDVLMKEFCDYFYSIVLSVKMSLCHLKYKRFYITGHTTSTSCCAKLLTGKLRPFSHPIPRLDPCMKKHKLC